MARPKLPEGVHRVSRKIEAGTRFHFYAWRSGPKFWEGPESYPTDPEFFLAFAAAVARPKPITYATPQTVDNFLSSAEMPKGERTRKDYRLWALCFADAFKAVSSDESDAILVKLALAQGGTR